MRIVEIRDLDGPNLFMMSPAIKIEIGDVPEEDQESIISRLEEIVRDLHRSSGVDAPEITSMRLETPGHVAVAFGWQRRHFALTLASRSAAMILGEDRNHDDVVEELMSVLSREPDADDAPTLVLASPDRPKIVAVTGTNGKTTTSRLIDFVLRRAGHSVGLTSSAGVFINKEAVLEGDYSGPSGARRVLDEPGIDFAILETARGGLLLRGCGYNQADVAIVTNVAADHLGLHGIHSLEGLAAVKSIIARNVKPGGFCVLNATDEHVLAMREVTPGTPVLFSPTPHNEALQSHVESGGFAISVDASRDVTWFQEGESRTILSLDDIPMTFGGKASHQVENALAAIAALIGLDVPLHVICEGIANFKSTAANSKGRLNVFDVNGSIVIIDFAHNEAGLAHLLNFSRNYVKEGGRLISVIGTAGDRDNHSLRAIAHRAVRDADVVVLKDSVHYLRGREPGEMLAEMRQAVRELDTGEAEILEAPDERTATFMMVEKLKANDVLAVMCVEDHDFILKELGKIGVEIA